MRKKTFALLIACCCLLISANIFSQTGIVINGKITGKDNVALSGATILEKGNTNNSTLSGSDGTFSIRVSKENAILLVSHVGYFTQDVRVGKGPVLIELQAGERSLGEVVIVGYGSVKKSDLTGSVSSVKAADLQELPVPRVDQALQGRAAGVMVLNSDGAPGGNTTIRVRGSNSITGGNAALIVIDGQQGGNISSLNPNDIESLEVLKDASATAIYGSKGANGVILITTKSGKKGRPAVSYGYNYGTQKLRKKLDLMNAGEYAKHINMFTALNNYPSPVPPIFTDSEVAAFEKDGGTDWQDVLYQTAPLQNHNLSVNGGSDNVSYFFSGGYLNQKGIVVSSDFSRINLRGNLKADVNKWFSTGLNLSFVRSLGNTPPFGEKGNSVSDINAQPIAQAPLWAATIPVYDNNGNYSRHPGSYGTVMSWNPLASAREIKTRNLEISNNANLFVEIKPLAGLSVKIMGAYYVATYNNRMFFNEKTFNGRLINGAYGEGLIDDGNYQGWQNTNIVTYDKEFGKHHFTITAVGEQQIENTRFTSLYAQGFTVPSNGLDDLSATNRKDITSGESERVLNSYLGRINYIFANRYLVTASWRADGSSVFGENNKWGTFPSVAVAWKLTEENFIKKIDQLSDLKLRASWGVVGNQAISPYQSLAALVSGKNSYPFMGSYPYNGTEAIDLGYRISRAANPNLRWESTTQTDIGLDFGLHSGRITGTIDWYKKTTKDLLLFRDLAAYTGLPSVIDNVGSSENRGWELSLGGDPFIGKFSWNTNFNISWNKNKVISMGDTKLLRFVSSGGGYGVTNLMFLAPGQPLGQMYGYETSGLWSEAERSEAADFGQLPGQVHYIDQNKDGVIDILDRVVIGNALPKYVFGFSNRFSFAGFDLNFLIQGVQGNNIFNMARVNLESPSLGTSRALLNPWTVSNQGSDIPAYIDAVTMVNANLTSQVKIDPLDANAIGRFVENGSYVRLKNITLGYTIKSNVLRTAAINKVRIYASAYNLYTLTKYKGYDPETSAYNSNDAQMGIDLGNYPTTRAFTFGVDVSF